MHVNSCTIIIYAGEHQMVLCRTTFDCSTNGTLMTARECCVDSVDGLAYSVPGQYECHICIGKFHYIHIYCTGVCTWHCMTTIIPLMQFLVGIKICSLEWSGSTPTQCRLATKRVPHMQMSTYCSM